MIRLNVGFEWQCLCRSSSIREREIGFVIVGVLNLIYPFLPENALFDHQMNFPLFRNYLFESACASVLFPVPNRHMLETLRNDFAIKLNEREQQTIIWFLPPSVPQFSTSLDPSHNIYMLLRLLCSPSIVHLLIVWSCSVSGGYRAHILHTRYRMIPGTRNTPPTTTTMNSRRRLGWQWINGYARGPRYLRNWSRIQIRYPLQQKSADNTKDAEENKKKDTHVVLESPPLIFCDGA